MNDGINDMVRDLKLIKYILIYVELHLIQIESLETQLCFN